MLKKFTNQVVSVEIDLSFEELVRQAAKQSKKWADNIKNDYEAMQTMGSDKDNPEGKPLIERRKQSPQEIEIQTYVAILRHLTDAQRMEIFAHFCTYCGNIDPKCYCMRGNDESA